MKLELGKTYVDRHGDVVGPMAVNTEEDRNTYPFIYLDDTYTTSGEFSVNLSNDPRDLVAEYQPSDQVNSPSHYTSGGIECIEAIRASLTPQEFRGFLKGNCLKYLWRYEKKENPLQDIEKTQWYLNRLQKEIKDDNN